MSFALVAALLSACGGQSMDKAAQLAALKDQKTQLEAEIAKLEKEIGSTEGSVQRVKTVAITEVKAGSFVHYIDLQGRVDAEENVPATAKMPGTLTRVLVKNGDVVKKGQLLAQIDDGVMLKQLAELENQLKTAEDLYNRQKGLWDQKIGTEVQFIQAKSQKESLERSIATLKESWNQTRIYAPIGGVVDLVVLKTGQAISPGMPLCNIVNLSDLKVVGEVTEAYAAKVRKGDLVNVFFPDLNKEIKTRVRYVSRTINPNTRTFSVECSLPTGRDYRANMVAVMKIIDYQNPKAIVIPVNLIQTAEGGEFALVVDKNGERKGVARKVEIKQGLNYNGMVEIASGLKNGDFVISTGFQDVNNGETVAF
ncbi:MAG: efflux RND transporter periplasmic adaptor subunit [Saprospiraceae bacterium]|nr:efflux RND transporter periplasmic adaptor subunit [Saprospiraceae bacterium]MCB0542767.1 efflux RND transporter periplasmic adaptor subunit [Saprospiraceae bacterium]MCB9352983.1 efflux RND transporter periplasmic adaptor subunit [Lewinellaceae bacterium]